MANQFVVQLKNTPGAMAILAEALASRGVDLRAIGGGGLGNSGHVIMTTADDETTKQVLDDGGYTYVEGESIIAEVDDKPGGMARIKDCGGLTVVQDPNEAQAGTMPEEAIRRCDPHLVLPLEGIRTLLPLLEKP